MNVESGTVFKELLDIVVSLPNEDQSFENSELTNIVLKESGYSRYEISNYSLPGHQSRHNRVIDWSDGGVLVKVPQVHPGGKSLQDLE